MKTIFVFALLAAAHGVAAQTPNTLTEAESQAGFKLLFDGKTTQGWRNYQADTLSPGWQVVDGALTRAGRAAGDIITRDQFTNFELLLEWRLSKDGPPGNSGIFYLVSEEPEAIYHGAPEMQILDNDRHGDGRSDLTSSGANYALHSVSHTFTKPVGEWNSVRIVVHQGKVEHWFNGTLVVSYELGSADWKERVARSKFVNWPAYGQARRGHIGLQDHGSFVAFRNVKIRELTP